jgi:Raf kinase inhibitor-like YbhB/YbcL family protein
MKINSNYNRHHLYSPLILMSVLFLAAVLPAGCESGEPPSEEVEMTLALSSTAFQDGGGIPGDYTCDGQDISPQLSWGEPPAGTLSLALIVDDMDTGGKFTHWVIFNIPSTSRELAEAVPAGTQLPDGALQGKNDFGNIGYGGPCPPYGKTHRYRFTLYALDTSLDLEAGASRKQVLGAMEGHIIARGQLIGTYQR